LILDKKVLAREVFFYALAILLLYFALQDTRPLDDDPDGPNYIHITFYQATIVFSGYILYVIVCSNFDTIVQCFSRTKKVVDTTLASSYNTKPNYGTAVTQKKLDLGKMEYLMEKVNLSEEPVGNWKSVEYYMPAVATTGEGVTVAPSTISSMRRGSLANSFRSSIFSLGNNVLKSLVKVSERPSEYHNLHDVHINEYKNQISCFLFQRSIFYNKAYFGCHAWQLRWFTISELKVSSVPDSCDSQNHRMRYPQFLELDIDQNRLIIKIANPVKGKRDFYLMAPSKPIFDKVVEKMEFFMDRNCSEDPGEENSDDDDDDDINNNEFDGADSFETLIEFNADSSNLETIFFLLLFPLRFLIHFTIPDVRSLDENGEMNSSVGKAYLSTLSCLMWLIIGSYAMVASLEALAELMDIPDAVIGFTVSAAGTSLPNYVASKVAAENGFGNQAVSNAFGSNTFNIMVGLGLPWMLYISLGNGFEPYHGLKDEQIFESIIILAVLLTLFVVLMIMSGCIIHKWHGIVFLISYGGYIAFAILQVYIGE